MEDPDTQASSPPAESLVEDAYGAKFEVTEGEDGDWYWHLLAANGEVIADGSEGYSRRADAINATGRVVALIRDAKVPE